MSIRYTLPVPVLRQENVRVALESMGLTAERCPGGEGLCLRLGEPLTPAQFRAVAGLLRPRAGNFTAE